MLEISGQAWKEKREKARKVKGIGIGRAIKWHRINCTHCRTGKGNLQAWRNKLNDSTDGTYRSCGDHLETGRHVGLLQEWLGRGWSTWEQADEKEKRRRKKEDENREYIVDLVEDFFGALKL